mmetsp:Transcript_98743/g.205822  ORF Transcript_98743/g.205822 Transcript_98743/m.205822 type:complete len:233 (-) Transcript_98743:166-864(-)|eukprot:CAMPEP_0206451212 /NCGR_PEP_ID=MMETSP0324_2-20121206/19200_1 /ASSEMBLY_ACC=CAM_ASM_000836 /TAXON_ID=2866 /ORGANISM="Crypthecodinium cohnii, Strain Seligo" /LENGTH=232 /DNA_ID=CAMNT_0053921037 /DNA_START=80 /DNA_END=778 /DNA_ORIENTATION=-
MATGTVCAPTKNWFGKLTNMRAPVPSHSGIYKLHLEYSSATIGSAEVIESVKLPDGLDRSEWIASQLCGIFEEVVQLVNVMLDVCTEDTCPRMNAGKYIHYAWADEHNPVARKVSAPEYMRTLLSYAEERLADRTVMPVDGSPFPPEFEPMVKTVCKRIFRVYAHTYLSHFQIIRDQGVEGHLNCNFKHFYYFVKEFGLCTEEDMQPLGQLIATFEENDRVNASKRASAAAA